jgi:hypothetical protein
MKRVEKTIKKIKAKFVKPIIMETPLPDLSILDGGTSVYIETTSIAEQSNEFRKDYRKVILCITNTNNIFQLASCRKLYNFFVSKHKLDVHDIQSKNYIANRFFAETICGYMENLLQQREATFGI